MQKENCIFSSWFGWPLTRKNINEMLFATISCRSCGNLFIYSVPANKQSLLSSWLGTHPNNTQEMAKVEMLNSFADHKNDKLSISPLVFGTSWNFLCVQALPLSLNLFIINMDETWGDERKTKDFKSNKVPSGSVGTSLDVLLSSVSYTALRGNESWYHASEWLNQAESLLSLDSYFVFY